MTIAAAISATTSRAGETGTAPQPRVEKTEMNPFSFYDGRVVFDVEERIRAEIRENNRDFDSSIDEESNGDE